VPLPPAQERRRAPWLTGMGALAKSTMWVVFAAAIPWLWFLVRDLGPVAEVVALALPVIVVAALIGLIISAFDDRKLSSLLVVVSVLAFGWVTIVEPRSAMPASPPVDPIRIASITLDASTVNASAIVGSIAKQRADVAIVVEPSKKARSVLLRADRSPYSLTSGRFVVLSTIPVEQLPLPKGLPDDLILRLQVDRPAGSFIVYAVRSGTSPLDAAQNDPLGIDRLRDAARDERLPVVLAGDFGISDRSSGYRTLTDSFRDAMRSGARAASTADTFPWTFLYLRTEFVLTSPDWCSGAGSTFDVQDAPSVGLVSAVGACGR
jgi:endonuclease/exonuclease/phosphatase (EEP) superfamily protein YafD